MAWCIVLDFAVGEGEGEGGEERSAWMLRWDGKVRGSRGNRTWAEAREEEKEREEEEESIQIYSTENEK